ncbi:MAG: hypothetical protein ACR2LK_12695 [Solirubrobacteraceae bacterium]
MAGIVNAVAEIRVSDHGGLFIADELRIEAPFVHASGRWRRRLGAGESWSDQRSYSWSAASIVQVRWLEAEATT